MNYIKEISADAFGVFAGDKINLIEHYNNLKNDKRPSFNFWVLLLGAYWLAYHQLFKLLAIYFGLFTVTVLVNPVFGILTMLGMNIALGVMGNKLYVQNASQRIHKIESIHTSETARNNVLSTARKTSKLAVIATVALFSLVVNISKENSVMEVGNVSREKQEVGDVTYSRLPSGEYHFETPIYDVYLKEGVRMKFLDLNADFVDADEREPNILKPSKGKELLMFDWSVNMKTLHKDKRAKRILLVTGNGDEIKESANCLPDRKWSKRSIGSAFEYGLTNFTYVACFEVDEADRGPFKLRIALDRNLLIPLS